MPVVCFYLSIIFLFINCINFLGLYSKTENIKLAWEVYKLLITIYAIATVFCYILISFNKSIQNNAIKIKELEEIIKKNSQDNEK